MIELPANHDFRFAVGERDEDGYCFVQMIAIDADGFSIFDGPDPAVIESLHLPYNEVGNFIASERECQSLAAEATEHGMGIYEYTCQPFGIEWQREQNERYAR